MGHLKDYDIHRNDVSARPLNLLAVSNSIAHSAVRRLREAELQRDVPEICNLYLPRTSDVNKFDRLKDDFYIHLVNTGAAQTSDTLRRSVANKIENGFFLNRIVTIVMSA